MARSPNAADMVSRFQAGIAGAGGKYTAGVQRVTDSPTAKAAAKVDDGTWAANTTAAAGRMSARLKAVSTEAWKQAISSYGASRYTSSAQKAAANYAKRAPELAAAAAAASQAAAAASGPLGKVQAAINAMKQAFGKPPI